MGDPKGFLKIDRQKPEEQPVAERIRHFGEFAKPLAPEVLAAQASRCMECGIPFCHHGCPLGNVIPEWNDKVFRGRMDEAVALLLSTNPFPGITGRVCPAPCEGSCVLNLENRPVSIKAIEWMIAEHARKGAPAPRPPREPNGRKVAVIGSGPAGMAAAHQLVRLGYQVTLLERDDRLGGLLRYGIPDFKLDKHLLDRCFEQLAREGVALRPGVEVGKALSAAELLAQHDALILAIGARRPRDLPIPGRALSGIHPAMDFLVQQNRRNAGDRLAEAGEILAAGRRVVVLGGGDTGADCVGTAIRQGARSVTQIEILPRPQATRAAENPWPEWPQILRTASSHEEGCERRFGLMTTAFEGQDGKLGGLRTVQVEFFQGKPVPLAGTEQLLEADLALLALGFLGPEQQGLVGDLGLALSPRGAVQTALDGATSAARVFATGDASRGQSLVVWAIADGLRVAEGVHQRLRGEKAATRAA